MEWLNALFGGILSGGAYAIMGVSVTLMYRSTGTLSFAHAAFAMLAAYVYSDLTISQGWSVGAAALAAMVLTLAFGVLVELLVMRPVRNASPTTRMIATVGVLGATSAAMLLIYGSLPHRAPRLLPEGGISLGSSIFFGYQELSVLAVAAVGGIWLALFLKTTRLGMAIRATADNAEVARLMGIPANRISMLNWIIAAAASGLAGLLVAPSTIVSVATFPVLELRALVGVLFAGLGGLVMTFVGGLILGVVESLTVLMTSTVGAQETVTLLLVVGILLVRKTWYTVAQESGVTFGEGRRSIPVLERWRHSATKAQLRPAGRLVTSLLILVTVLHAVLQPAGSEFWAFVWGLALFYMLQGVSLVLLSGWGGQITLMQGAYAGIGAYGVLYFVNSRGWSIEFAVIGAVAFATGVGALVGLPALRVAGPQFAIVSLAFGAWASAFLFSRSDLQGTLPRTSLLGVDVTSDRSLYIIMAVATLLAFLAAWNIRRSLFGTMLLASRDNPLVIMQFGGRPNRIKMTTFVLASAIAGLGGAFYGLLLTGFRPTDFAVTLSINLLLFTVVGGITSLGGPIIAGALFLVLPAVLQGTSDTGNGAQIAQLVGALIVVVVLALRPGGLVSLSPFGRQAGSTPRTRDALPDRPWLKQPGAEARYTEAMLAETQLHPREFASSHHRSAADSGSSR